MNKEIKELQKEINEELLKCSFCEKEKPKSEIRRTQDNKDYVCRFINECEGLQNE